MARHISLFFWWNSAPCTLVAWCQYRYMHHGSKNILYGIIYKATRKS